jgi:glycosyltransferase involved in cell wall biosynthesis
VLVAIKNQSLNLNNWELLLIDNNSNIPLSERYDLSWHPHARHLREPKLGKLNAWVHGISESKADIIVFVDDDTVLSVDYLEKALLISEQWPFVGAWCGSAVPEFETPLPDWVGDHKWRLTVVDVQKDVWSNLSDNFITTPYGAGMCIRRNVVNHYLDRIRQNPNSIALDRSGKDLGGYGDIDLAFCAVDLGLGTGKSAKLSLTHLIPSSRLTLDYFVRHAEGDAQSLQLFRALRGLALEKPKRNTWLESLRWFLHRRIHHIPQEQYEIARAHQRGLRKGWELAKDVITNDLYSR